MVSVRWTSSGFRLRQIAEVEDEHHGRHQVKRNDKVVVIAGKDKGRGPRPARHRGQESRPGRGRHDGEEAREPNPQRGTLRVALRSRSPPSTSRMSCCSTPMAIRLASVRAWKATRGFVSRRPVGTRSPRRRSKEVFSSIRFTPRIGKRSHPPRHPWRKRREIMAARLKEKYEKEIRQSLGKELSITNAMAIPKLEKIVINMGLGEATQNVKIMDPLIADLAAIAGQKPVTTKAKKSIAAFKVREACRSARWLHCVATRLRVPGPPDLDRSAPRSRLPRCFVEELRRPRQLHPRTARSAYLRRNRLCEGRQDQGYERHHRHHREG